MIAVIGCPGKVDVACGAAVELAAMPPEPERSVVTVRSFWVAAVGCPNPSNDFALTGSATVPPEPPACVASDSIARSASS